MLMRNPFRSPNPGASTQASQYFACVRAVALAAALAWGPAFSARVEAQTFPDLPIDRSPPGQVLPKPDARLQCKCSETTGAISFSGIAVDAEFSASPDGRSVVGRQKTIFEVTRSPSHPRGARLKVSHPTPPAPCGVSFNYGARYDLTVRQAGDELETDYCLVPQPAPPQPEN